MLYRTCRKSFLLSRYTLVPILATCQTRSGRRYSAWGDATIVKIDVDASALLRRSLELDHNCDYDNEASPEFTPTSTPSHLLSPPSTPRLTVDTPTSADATTHALCEVSKRLSALVPPMHAPSPIRADTYVVSRKSKRNATKRMKDHRKKGMTDESIDPLQQRRKIRSSVSIKYARPRMIKANFIVAALTIAQYANVGVNRPAGRSVPSLAELKKSHPDFTVIENPDL